MLNKNGINVKLIKVYTISASVGVDKLALMKECEKDALDAGGTIVSVTDENHLVIIKAEMPMK